MKKTIPTLIIIVLIVVGFSSYAIQMSTALSERPNLELENEEGDRNVLEGLVFTGYAGHFDEEVSYAIDGETNYESTSSLFKNLGTAGNVHPELAERHPAFARNLHGPYHEDENFIVSASYQIVSNDLMDYHITLKFLDKQSEEQWELEIPFEDASWGWVESIYLDQTDVHVIVAKEEWEEHDETASRSEHLVIDVKQSQVVDRTSFEGLIQPSATELEQQVLIQLEEELVVYDMVNQEVVQSFESPEGANSYTFYSYMLSNERLYYYDHERESLMYDDDGEYKPLVDMDSMNNNYLYHHSFVGEYLYLLFNHYETLNVTHLYVIDPITNEVVYSGDITTEKEPPIELYFYDIKKQEM
ncbi:hypothetical protein [Geomicrobium sp. JCM 19055]|uniref:hypothetical protein n=1 Tax=Geomicrobium sp. JCM 19055 TaxID=1460649 RepID=UPI00045ED3B2|nr:hypothetical protein [Geomicrobium sp. JCM 19055]GAJ98447.1 hypothetical protein JCM19055_1374 [Geomicrobium sp. JCM 19055]